MKNQDKFSSAVWFIVGTGFLCFGLTQFSLALTWRPLDNNFLGGELAVPLAPVLTFLFGLGWWLEWFFEKTVPNLGRNVTVWFLLGLLLVYLIIALGSFLFPIGLFRFVLVAGDTMVLSGFWFRLSRIRPETLAKMRTRTSYKS